MIREVKRCDWVGGKDEDKIDFFLLLWYKEAIKSLINPHVEKPISYPAYRYFVRQDPVLLNLWQAQRL